VAACALFREQRFRRRVITAKRRGAGDPKAKEYEFRVHDRSVRIVADLSVADTSAADIIADHGRLATAMGPPMSVSPFSSPPRRCTIDGVVDENDGMSGRARALTALGLRQGASEADILLAYKTLAAPLKRGLTSAVSLDEKNKQRKDLRRYVEARDAALGRTRETGKGAEAGASTVLEKLDGISTERPDRDKAVRVMGLAPDASDADVLALYK
jgi:hypothetical protein